MPKKEATRKGWIIAGIRAREKKVLEKEYEMYSHNRMLDELYEKVYFHEIDGRDKVAQRLQLPLVTFVALAGVIGQMLQNAQRNDSSANAVWFWVLLGLAVLTLVGAGIYFVLAVVGKTYSYLPDSEEWRKHHKECIYLYEDYNNADVLVTAAIKKNVTETYVKCATANGAINAKKAAYVFQILRLLIATAIFTFMAFSFFIFGKLDKNLVRSTQKVEVINPVVVKEDTMTNQKPPPPPPPPPTRQVREDRGTPLANNTTQPTQPQPPSQKGK
jgi:flagellar basal body-associated protein FliL